MSVVEPIDETKSSIERIRILERQVKVGQSDVETVVKQTVRMYRDVRRMESTVRRLEGLTTIGIGIPKIGPYTAFIMLIIQMATMIVEKGTQEEKERLEKEMEIKIQALRTELLEEVKADLEARRRESFRSVVPG